MARSMIRAGLERKEKKTNIGERRNIHSESNENAEVGFVIAMCGASRLEVEGPKAPRIDSRRRLLQ